MSRTLVEGSGANSGADFLGKGNVYKKIYSDYTSGKIDMEELLTKTFACWKGLKISDLPKVYARFEFNDGVKETIRKMKKKGIKIMLLTNIPTHLGKLFQEKLDFNYIGGTTLEVKDGIFTGRILKFSHDKTTEAMKILKKEKISPNDAISIGDRKDDAKVFEKVRFGIAYDGDEVAKKTAKYQITDFRDLLNIIEKES